jgi:hypothetical protein
MPLPSANISQPHPSARYDSCTLFFDLSNPSLSNRSLGSSFLCPTAVPSVLNRCFRPSLHPQPLVGLKRGRRSEYALFTSFGLQISN